MDAKTVTNILESLGVIMHGHFKLTSGKHSPTFLQCSHLMQHPHETERLVKELVAPFAAEQIDVVVGPAMGGIILAYEAARQLGCQCMYAEKDGDQMRFRRGFKLQAHQRVLVVEDAVTTGGSVRKAMAAVAEAGADIIGVAALVDRSNGRVHLHDNQRFLLSLDIPAYEPEHCPLCGKGMELVHPKDL